jgi:hypothetical protein
MPSKAQWPRLLIAILVIACTENPAGPQPLDLTGAWYGANSAVTLDLRLSNATLTYPCGMFGCSGMQTMEQIRLEGTYKNLRTGESIDLVSDTQRRADGLVVFTLFGRDDGGSPGDTVTYATTRLVGQVVDETAIEAYVVTDYARSSGGISNTWTTWTADSTTLTLYRR